MKKTRNWIVGVTILFAAIGANLISAAEKPAAPSPEQAAMMAQMQKLTSPGENHKRLEIFVGKWKHTIKFWMSPEEKPSESSGANENKWILGGRFLEIEVKGQWMGQPFEGLGLVGYDNIRGEYSSVWLDSASTSIMVGAAQFDAPASTFNENGTVACPLTGEKNRKYRVVWKITDHDHYIYEMYMADKTGKEFKAMEISYERAK